MIFGEQAKRERHCGRLVSPTWRIIIWECPVVVGIGVIKYMTTNTLIIEKLNNSSAMH